MNEQHTDGAAPPPHDTAADNVEDVLERVHKPPSSQVSFSTQRGPHRWLRGSPEDAPATLVRLLTLRNGAGAGAERRVTAGGRRIVCGWHQRILGSIKT